MTVGQLHAIGLGPGDPELITVKAIRILGEADVVAYFSGTAGRSIARSIAKPHLRRGVIEELMRYPVTTGTTDHAGGYYGVIDEFYDTSATSLAEHLRAGRNVVVLAEGDPLFYGSWMYLRDRLAGFQPVVVPGVTSISGATAALGRGLCRHEDVLTVLPGTLPVPELAWRLAQTEAAIVMKLGRTFAGVREALRQAGRLDDAWYVERATFDTERILPVAEVDPASVPYFAMIVVVGHDRRADTGGRHAPEPSRVGRATGQVSIVGLGPGPDRWLTPEASAVLAEVDHVVGYAPYVDRVPQRPGLTRHPSGNTVEVDRARAALDLAGQGAHVAVVSGGDAGVFGMAAAVFEAREDPSYSGIPVEVIPGVTAAQVVAARAGAPLGADFAVLSLSNRLKPWSVLADRLRATAEADLVIALYNPRSRTRPHQLEEARQILLEVRRPETIVVVGRDIGRVDEELHVTTLGDWDTSTVDMKCLVLIGASSTRLTRTGQVWTPRFVAEAIPSPSGS